MLPAIVLSSLHRQRGPRHVVRSLLPRVLHVHHRPRRLGHHQGDARSVNGRIRRVAPTRRFTASSALSVNSGTSSMGAEVFETFVIRPARRLSVVRDAQKTRGAPRLRHATFTFYAYYHAVRESSSLQLEAVAYNARRVVSIRASDYCSLQRAYFRAFSNTSHSAPAVTSR